MTINGKLQTGYPSCRVIVGERGNEQGHIILSKYHHPLSWLGAKRILARELAKYNGDGWGRIEQRADNGQWIR